MAIVYVDTVLPETSGVSENLNLGAVGDTVTVPAGATLKTNKIADAGGNNVITSDGSGNLTVNGSMQGDVALLQTQTASNSAAIEFTNVTTGVLSTTYKTYLITWVGIDVATNDTYLKCNASQTASSPFTYNQYCTTTFYHSYNRQTAGSSDLGYSNGRRVQQATTGFNVGTEISNAAGDNACGEMWFFNPAGATSGFDDRVKCFHTTQACWSGGTYQQNSFVSGYFNPNSANAYGAITAIKFFMSSGNIVAGTFKMYGIK